MVRGDLLHACSACGAARILLLDLGLRRLCASCWHAEGELGPRFAPPDWLHEEEIRRQMIQRGGTDRHMARSGKT